MLAVALLCYESDPAGVPRFGETEDFSRGGSRPPGGTPCQRLAASDRCILLRSAMCAVSKAKRRHGRYKGNARVITDQALTDVLSLRVPRVVRQGIARVPSRAPRPQAALTARHEAVLAVLGPEPVGPAHIARVTGLTPGSVTSALYVLAGRGLAHRLGHGKGWIRG